MMPVDAIPVRYQRMPNSGDLTVITADGRIDRGIKSEHPDSVGFISHFATCPNANQHRKR